MELTFRHHIKTTGNIVRPRLVAAFSSVAATWTIVAAVALLLTSSSASESFATDINNQWSPGTQVGLVIVSITGACLLLLASKGSLLLLAPIIWLVPLLYGILLLRIFTTDGIWYLPPLVLLLVASFVTTSIYTAINSNRGRIFQLFTATLAAIIGFFLVRWQFTNVLIAIARETETAGEDKPLLMAYGSAAVFTLLTLFLAGGVISSFRNAVSNSRKTVLLTGAFSGCLMLGSIIGLSFGGWLMIPSTLLMGLATLISNARDPES